MAIREVLSSEVDITWRYLWRIISISCNLCLRPPSNSDILGSQLLGYRVYIREVLCGHDSCLEKKTISDPASRSARIGYLSK